MVVVSDSDDDSDCEVTRADVMFFGVFILLI